MNEEYKSIQDNKVGELISLLEGTNPIGYKWIFKTKQGTNGNVKSYKSCLMAKGFNQRKGISFKNTFSPVSTKDSLRTIMALVTYFDLEFY